MFDIGIIRQTSHYFDTKDDALSLQTCSFIAFLAKIFIKWILLIYVAENVENFIVI